MQASQKFVRNLLDWFQRSARDLPWRQTRDPYAIWISEVMLQQTQVRAVIPYWEKWLALFPTVQSLALAPLESVLKAWEGLGYYTRARQAHRAAGILLAKHNGQLPASAADLRRLPGIGPYTAGAISSIAFDHPEPAVDGNVNRVLARCFAMKANPRSPAGAELFWRRARQLVNAAAATGRRRACGSFNQALMELGALICQPRNPSCNVCPVRLHCRARQQDRVAQFPKLPPQPKSVPQTFFAFVAIRNNRFLVRQRPAAAVNGGLWEFPNQKRTRGKRVDELAREQLGFRPGAVRRWLIVRHSIMQYRLTLRVFICPTPGRSKNDSWRSLRELSALPFPSAHRKILNCLEKLAGKPMQGK